MQVTETLSEGLKRGFTVVVPAADIESKRAARLANLGKTLRLPGFRPGKIPTTVVRQRYGAAVNAEVAEESVSEATKQVLSERGLRPALQPRIDVVSADPVGLAASDLEFKVELELLPEITMPDFAAIRLTRMKVEPDPERVETSLASIAQRHRTLEPILPEELGERGAAKGEVLTVDYIGRIDGVEFAGGTGTGVEVEIGGTGFIPGFSEQLEGMKPSETRTIEVTFPAEYGAPDLAGKLANFDVTAQTLNRAVVPALDDEFAKQAGLDDIAAMRQMLTERMQLEYDQLARLRLKRQLLDALAEATSFASPEGMVDQEFNSIWQRLEADRQAGRLDDDDKDKDDEALKTEYRAIAERRVRLGLLLGEVGRANSITVGQDEMARAMRAEAMRYQGQEQKVFEFFRQNPQATETLRGPIFEEKVVDFILELATVEDVPATVQELVADPPAPSAGEAGSATEPAADAPAPMAGQDHAAAAHEVSADPPARIAEDSAPSAEAAAEPPAASPAEDPASPA